MPHWTQCPFCQSTRLSVRARYSRPPQGETVFPFSSSPDYYREFLECDVCGHLLSDHQLNLDNLYEGGYVDASYGEDGMRRSFERITNLPDDRSDNKARVRRVDEFGRRHLSLESQAPSLLDIGAGLAVFPYGMRLTGWNATALDPDSRAGQHARDVAGVNAITADFCRDTISGSFDLITFNKVLEHVVDPVDMLARAKPLLASGGMVYVELPDGEMAMRDHPDREEFCIEHYHAFSMASASLLAKQAGFDVVHQSRLIEPSTKYTLFFFATA